MGNLFVLLQYLIPHHALSRFTGWLANCRVALVKKPFIYLFARHFKVDLSEARIKDYREFRHFNEFFTRELQEGSRPLAGDQHTVTSPADGFVSELGKIQEGRLLQAKGIDYSATDLLGGDELDALPFQNGSFITVYLSPGDYHRVHMPIAGTLRKTVYVPGRLFSVNRRTAHRVPGLFTRNERLVCFFDTAAGPMALILVGAMIVAGIETVWGGQACPTSHGLLRTDHANLAEPVELARGEEMGRFMLGSTVILLFGPQAVTLNKDLQADQAIRLGQAVATLNQRQPNGDCH